MSTQTLDSPATPARERAAGRSAWLALITRLPVSYTHLTLPTILLV